MKKKDFDRWQELAAMKKKAGAVCAWFVDDEARGALNVQKYFDTIEEARAFAALYDDMLASIAAPAAAWQFGTVADLESAKVEAAKAAADLEQRKYADHVAGLVEDINAEIEALEALKMVCKDFDGKVINKRFHTAVTAATGLNSYFDDYRGLVLCSGWTQFHRMELNIYTDFSGRDDVRPGFWLWGTNSRMEADKAAGVIDGEINHRNDHRAALLASLAAFADYVARARRLAKEIEAMKAADYDMRNYARDHVFGRLQASAVWHTY